MIFRRDVATSLQKRVAAIKKARRPTPYDWYRFDSFSNLTHLDQFLPQGLQTLIALAEGDPIADIGSADGDLAFLLEALGCSVTAIDWPATNANRMLGIALLKHELQSGVQILRVDLDEQFDLPGERFGVVVGLGLLYHLKNPFFFLEKLSRHARHCVLSTRILPRAQATDAVAYLAGYREFQDDPTNYWLFSEAGLRRLLDRTGWHIELDTIIGDGVDDRFFCHLRSRFAGSVRTLRLSHGWHELENGAWRWTQRSFGVVVENPEPARELELQFRLRPELLAQGNPLVLSARVHGTELDPATYTEPGDHMYVRSISLPQGRCELEFSLGHAMFHDGRELGVVVVTPPDGVVSPSCGIRFVP